MNKEELQKEIIETFSPIFRIAERNEVAMFQLIELLNNKGIITKEDYEKYLSNNAINNKIKEMEVVLGDEYKI